MQEKGNFDVIIAGGGPAGLSALQWCRDLGMTAILIEKEAALGGQLLDIFAPVTNYLGVEAANGRELRDIFVRDFAGGAVDRVTGAEIVKADLGQKTVAIADGRSYTAKAIIIATGVRRRELGIPGEHEFHGRGVMRSGSKERNEVAGKLIVIIGGGDAALENALILAEAAAHVVVIHRRETFAARADFLDRAMRSSQIELLTNTTVAALVGNEEIGAVEIESVATGERRLIDADGVLIRVGFIPNTELFRGQIELDAAGYVIIDRNCAASGDNIYAIGDIANRHAPTIIAAAGQGAMAAKAIAGQLHEHSTCQ